MKYIALLKTQHNEHAIYGLSFGQALEYLNEQMEAVTDRVEDALILEDRTFDPAVDPEGSGDCKLIASLRTVK